METHVLFQPKPKLAVRRSLRNLISPTPFKVATPAETFEQDSSSIRESIYHPISYITNFNFSYGLPFFIYRKKEKVRRDPSCNLLQSLHLLSLNLKKGRLQYQNLMKRKKKTKKNVLLRGSLGALLGQCPLLSLPRLMWWTNHFLLSQIYK